MALGIPELRRVRPATALKTGPLLSSSHAMHGASEPSGMLYVSVVERQIWRQRLRVFAVSYAHACAHGRSKPSCSRHGTSPPPSGPARSPHDLTGPARSSFFMYTARLASVEQTPQWPKWVTLAPAARAASCDGYVTSSYGRGLVPALPCGRTAQTVPGGSSAGGGFA